MADLLVIVPSFGRPASLPRVVEAWMATNGFAAADLVFALDHDDPTRPAYIAAPVPPGAGSIRLVSMPRWRPMVPKLNSVAVEEARRGRYFALGFAGDDHLPRTVGWATRYLEALRELGSGIVYGDDGYRGEGLPTQWAMTADIVAQLGRMVPAPVDHLYCDDAVLALGRAAGNIRYLADVLIEHMHPIAGKADLDDGYRLANAPGQYERDGTAFRRWLAEGLPADLARLAGTPVGSG